MMDAKDDGQGLTVLDMSMAVCCDRAAKTTDFSINFVSDDCKDAVANLSTIPSSNWNPLESAQLDASSVSSVRSK